MRVPVQQYQYCLFGPGTRSGTSPVVQYTYTAVVLSVRSGCTVQLLLTGIITVPDAGTTTSSTVE